jgi:hypothetical protein
VSRIVVAAHGGYPINGLAGSARGRRQNSARIGLRVVLSSSIWVWPARFESLLLLKETLITVG